MERVKSVLVNQLSLPGDFGSVATPQNVLIVPKAITIRELVSHFYIQIFDRSGMNGFAAKGGNFDFSWTMGLSIRKGITRDEPYQQIEAYKAISDLSWRVARILHLQYSINTPQQISPEPLVLERVSKPTQTKGSAVALELEIQHSYAHRIFSKWRALNLG